MPSALGPRQRYISASVTALILVSVLGVARAERRIGLTAYTTNLALVRDTRTYELTRGVNEIHVADVPAQIDPTSVLLSGEGLQVLEQNFEYDLASADRILDRYLEREVTVVLESGDAFTGRLVSYESRALVLTSDAAGTQVISRDRVDRIDFPELPGGLTTRPTLVWTLDAAAGGEAEATMSYLTGGVGWHAEYVALVDAGDSALELSAWVSLDNRSGATFEEATLQLVAGDIHRAPQAPRSTPTLDAMYAKGAEGASEETFFEYHLYTYDRPVTIKDRQTKQLTLFPTANVSDVVKSYRYSGGRDVRVVLEFTNAENAGLGLALPAGTVRVYKADSRGGTQLVGEDRIDHTPRDETLELTMGNAFDIVAERTVVRQETISRNVSEQDVEVEVRNRKDEDVVVFVEERTWGDWEIVTASHVWDRESASKLVFTVPVSARSTVKLTFKLRTRR